ncbi:hypothetical protein JCM11491_005268 [Sporobolomyces phaffii]
MDVSSSAPRPRGGGGQDGPLSSAVARDDAATRPDQVMTDDMRLAVSALGLLRSEGGPGGGGAPPPPPPHHHLDDHHDPSTSSSAASTSTWTAGTGTGTTSSPVTTTTTTSELGERGDYFFDAPRAVAVGGESDPKFIERVAQLPLVSGGLEWYERSKQTSRVVKYGAGWVESSFSAVSRPIANNLQLGPLDDFACRQLDRIGGGGNVHTQKNDEHSDAAARRGDDDDVGAAARDESPQDRPHDEVAVQNGGPRSRWQTVLVEAGGLGAAVSEESLKSLRYCLQWLVYATAHLDHQISTLRDFILSLRAHNRTHPSSSTSTTSHHHHALVAESSARLTQIKHDVVETIRKVVEVVSKYAGAALPEPAKRYVKQSILGLPVKWASAIEHRTTGGGDANSTARRRRRRSSSSSMDGQSTRRDGQPERDDDDDDEAASEAARAALGPTEEAADRVLTFAVESLDMLRSVANIFGESVEKAEAWIERLRIVGLQRQRQRQEQELHDYGGQQQQHDHDRLLLGPPPAAAAAAAATTTTSSDTRSHEMTATASGGMKRRRRGTVVPAGRNEFGGEGSDAIDPSSGGGAGGGEATMTDGEEVAASARRKRGARSREMSAQ